MNDRTREALSNTDTWARLPVMLLFYLLLAIATPLLMVVSLAGWVMRLFTGERTEGVTEFGDTLAAWFSQTARYLTGGESPGGAGRTASGMSMMMNNAGKAIKQVIANIDLLRSGFENIIRNAIRYARMSAIESLAAGSLEVDVQTISGVGSRGSCTAWSSASRRTSRATSPRRSASVSPPGRCATATAAWWASASMSWTSTTTAGPT